MKRLSITEQNMLAALLKANKPLKLSGSGRYQLAMYELRRRGLVNEKCLTEIGPQYGAEYTLTDKGRKEIIALGGDVHRNSKTTLRSRY